MADAMTLPVALDGEARPSPNISSNTDKLLALLNKEIESKIMVFHKENEDLKKKLLEARLSFQARSQMAAEESKAKLGELEGKLSDSESTRRSQLDEAKAREAELMAKAETSQSEAERLRISNAELESKLAGMDAHIDDLRNTISSLQGQRDKSQGLAALKQDYSELQVAKNVASETAETAALKLEIGRTGLTGQTTAKAYSRVVSALGQIGILPKHDGELSFTNEWSFTKIDSPKNLLPCFRGLTTTCEKFANDLAASRKQEESLRVSNAQLREALAQSGEETEGTFLKEDLEKATVELKQSKEEQAKLRERISRLQVVDEEADKRELLRLRRALDLIASLADAFCRDGETLLFSMDAGACMSELVRLAGSPEGNTIVGPEDVVSYLRSTVTRSIALIQTQLKSSLQAEAKLRADLATSHAKIDRVNKDRETAMHQVGLAQARYLEIQKVLKEQLEEIRKAMEAEGLVFSSGSLQFAEQTRMKLQRFITRLGVLPEHPIRSPSALSLFVESPDALRLTGLANRSWEDPSKQEQDFLALRKQRDELQGQLDSLRGQLDSLRIELDNTHFALADLMKKFAVETDLVKTLRDVKAELKASNGQLELERDDALRQVQAKEEKRIFADAVATQSKLKLEEAEKQVQSLQTMKDACQKTAIENGKALEQAQNQNMVLFKQREEARKQSQQQLEVKKLLEKELKDRSVHMEELEAEKRRLQRDFSEIEQLLANFGFEYGPDRIPKFTAAAERSLSDFRGLVSCLGEEESLHKIFNAPFSLTVLGEVAVCLRQMLDKLQTQMSSQERELAEGRIQAKALEDTRKEQVEVLDQQIRKLEQDACDSERQMNALRASGTELRKTMAGVEGNAKEQEQELLTTRESLSKTQATLAEVDAALKAKKAEHDRLVTEMSSLKEENEKIRKELADAQKGKPASGADKQPITPPYSTAEPPLSKKRPSTSSQAPNVKRRKTSPEVICIDSEDSDAAGPSTASSSRKVPRPSSSYSKKRAVDSDDVVEISDSDDVPLPKRVPIPSQKVRSQGAAIPKPRSGGQTEPVKKKPKSGSQPTPSGSSPRKKAKAKEVP